MQYASGKNTFGVTGGSVWMFRTNQKLKKIINDRKRASGYLMRNSKVFSAFTELESKTFTDDNLSKKNKELIAIGISIVKNCESCLEWHIHEAIKDGASEKEILEAMEVGMEMGGGPAAVSAQFGLKVLEFYSESPV